MMSGMRYSSVTFAGAIRSALITVFHKHFHTVPLAISTKH
jgi:hypothetical protein